MRRKNLKNRLFAAPSVMAKKIFLLIVKVGILFAVATFILPIFHRDTEPGRDAEPEIITTSGVIQRGDTIEQILMNKNVAYPEIIGITRALNQKYRVRRIKPGQRYEFFTSTCGAVLGFNHWINDVEYISIKKPTEKNEFYPTKKIVPSEKILITVSGKIQSSLYESMIERGVSPEIVMRFADIFSWQIDPLTELRKEDTFELVYEEYKFANNITRPGKILIARYRGKKTAEHTGVYFEDTAGRSDYYDPQGNSLGKMFLRTPLNYRRISSHFTYRRFHPILRRWMPSLAIDYAAPTGTPVVAVADGKVIYADRGKTRLRRGLGTHVIVRHNHVYTTWYSHLSRLARGIRKGRRVRQGQVIGYVGSTGLSTGPHLDFRVEKYGRFVNFLKLKFPPSKSIPAERRNEFEKVLEDRLGLLNSALACKRRVNDRL